MKTDNKKKIAFIGGDMRSSFAAKSLSSEGYAVSTWGLQSSGVLEGVRACADMKDAISDADVIVLPIPTSLDGASLNCRSEEEIALRDVVSLANKHCVLVGGRLSDELLKCCEEREILAHDCLSDEGLLASNAYITAEAALSIAMSKLQKTIHGARFAVTGYGRISKALARLLHSLGAEVTVAARKESDILSALAEGYGALRLNKDPIERLCEGYDIIFNTVPHCIFEESAMQKIDPKTLFIELASPPGGVDVSVAKRLRSNVLWAASLPGKYAPESAGELISDFVKDILQREVTK